MANMVSTLKRREKNIIFQPFNIGYKLIISHSIHVY
jgi:hypothetical protein